MRATDRALNGARPATARRPRASDRDRGGGEREVVARARARRRAAGRRARAVAADLERGGDVERAVEHAGVIARITPTRAAGGRGGSAGPRRFAARRGASSGTIRVASVAVSAERNETRRSERSTSSGSTAARYERAAQDQRSHEPEARAVDDRLERDVELAEDRQSPSRASTVRPLRLTSALIDDDATAIGNANSAASGALRGPPRPPTPAASDRQRERPERHRAARAISAASTSARQ